MKSYLRKIHSDASVTTTTAIQRCVRDSKLAVKKMCVHPVHQVKFSDELDAYIISICYNVAKLPNDEIEIGENLWFELN